MWSAKFGSQKGIRNRRRGISGRADRRCIAGTRREKTLCDTPLILGAVVIGIAESSSQPGLCLVVEKILTKAGLLQLEKVSIRVSRNVPQNKALLCKSDGGF